MLGEISLRSLRLINEEMPKRLSEYHSGGVCGMNLEGISDEFHGRVKGKRIFQEISGVV